MYSFIMKKQKEARVLILVWQGGRHPQEVRNSDAIEFRQLVEHSHSANFDAKAASRQPAGQMPLSSLLTLSACRFEIETGRWSCNLCQTNLDHVVGVPQTQLVEKKSNLKLN